MYKRQPEDRDHGEAWQTANRAIGDKYDELLNAPIPDDDPGVLVPHEVLSLIHILLEFWRTKLL